MTGSLLQLVATGIDSIFLTHNPSVTLFKIVYRRYTNFSITTRTKQIKNITEFDKEGYYILQKEADCIHKLWLNINISDLKIEYPKSTYKNILELFTYDVLTSVFFFSLEYFSVSFFSVLFDNLFNHKLTLKDV
jgi:hypothetical protein